MVASEEVPVAKTGGLGDGLGALPRALVGLGHEVDVVIPRYRGIGGEQIGRISIGLGGLTGESDVYATVVEGVRTVFIDHPSYYDREYLYGTAGRDYADNPERFAWLCQGALNWAISTGRVYDVVHAHDWQAGLVPVFLDQMSRATPALAAISSVFTIHNLAYQGVFDASWLPRLGLSWDFMRIDALEYWGRISLLKAGIVFSRSITTVSPRYSHEIQTPESGFGFDGILRQRSSDLVGILNGIDYDQWDPARDPNLPT